MTRLQSVVTRSRSCPKLKLPDPARLSDPEYTQGLSKKGVSENQRGLFSEERVLNICRTAYPGADVRAETDKQIQRFKDIDGYVAGYAVSIKDQSRAHARSGNISFELEVFFKYTSQWEPGNAARCAADYYLILVDEGLYQIPVETIKDIAASSHNYRISENRSTTVAAQIAMGHPHINARNLLIPLRDLKEKGIARLVPQS